MQPVLAAKDEVRLCQFNDVGSNGRCSNAGGMFWLILFIGFRNSKLGNVSNYSVYFSIIFLACYLLWTKLLKPMFLKSKSMRSTSLKDNLRNALRWKLVMFARQREGLKRLKLSCKLESERTFCHGRSRVTSTRTAALAFVKRKRVEENKSDARSDSSYEVVDKVEDRFYQSEEFYRRIERFLSRVDVLSLHQCSTLLFEPEERRKLCQLQDEVEHVKKSMDDWIESANFFSDCTKPLHMSTSINAGNIFFVQGSAPELPIVLDTGASKSLSPNRSDFISFKKILSTVSGIGAKSQEEGIGKVRWRIFDQNGVERTIETVALYMPSARVRLYSPQTHFKEHQSGAVHMTWKTVTLQLPNDSTSLTFPFNQMCNLPLMLLKEKVEAVNYGIESSPVVATIHVKDHFVLLATWGKVPARASQRNLILVRQMER